MNIEDHVVQIQKRVGNITMGVSLSMARGKKGKLKHVLLHISTDPYSQFIRGLGSLHYKIIHQVLLWPHRNLKEVAR